MQQINKSKASLLLLLVICSVLPVVVIAQDPGANPDLAIPIDGGLSLLIAAGVGYGVRQIRTYKKRRQDQEKS